MAVAMTTRDSGAGGNGENGEAGPPPLPFLTKTFKIKSFHR